MGRHMCTVIDINWALCPATYQQSVNMSIPANSPNTVISRPETETTIGMFGIQDLDNYILVTQTPLFLYYHHHCHAIR